MHWEYLMFSRKDATTLQKLPQVNWLSGCRDIGLLKSPLQQNTLNTLFFSRSMCHDRHLDALRVVNYGVEGMGLPNKENCRSIGPAVAEIWAYQKRFRAGPAGPGRSYWDFSVILKRLRSLAALARSLSSNNDGDVERQLDKLTESSPSDPGKKVTHYLWLRNFMNTEECRIDECTLKHILMQTAKCGL